MTRSHPSPQHLYRDFSVAVAVCVIVGLAPVPVTVNGYVPLATELAVSPSASSTIRLQDLVRTQP